MLQLKRVLGACILVNALLTIVAGCQHYLRVAHAATYYVATTGSNSNPGTEAKPFGTIAHAVDTMVAGDTTYVRGGTYNESGVRFRRSGTSSSPIRLLNYPGESPVLDCTAFSTESNSFLFMNGTNYNLAIGWINLEGFEVRDCRDGIKLYNLHDSSIRRMWIHNNWSAGILGWGARVLIEKNIVASNGTSTLPNHGIYLNGTYITIINNLIYDNYNFGLQQNGSSSKYNSALHAGTEFATAANWIIANNTFAYNQRRAGIVVWGSLCTNARIENNIFYENGVTLASGETQGVDFVSAGRSTGVTIRNNHFYASGSGAQQALGSVQPTGLVNTGNVVNVSAPAFVNAPAELPASPNFSLTARSPVIDKGLSPSDETSDETPRKTLRTAFDDALLKALRTDFAGTTRPQGRANDIGAYEYSADGDTHSPRAPTSLQAH